MLTVEAQKGNLGTLINKFMKCFNKYILKILIKNTQLFLLLEQTQKDMFGKILTLQKIKNVKVT